MNMSLALSVASVDRKNRSNQMLLYCVAHESVWAQAGHKGAAGRAAVAWLDHRHDTGRSCCAAACPERR